MSAIQKGNCGASSEHLVCINREIGLAWCAIHSCAGPGRCIRHAVAAIGDTLRHSKGRESFSQKPLSHRNDAGYASVTSPGFMSLKSNSTSQGRFSGRSPLDLFGQLRQIRIFVDGDLDLLFARRCRSRSPRGGRFLDSGFRGGRFRRDRF